MRENDSSSAYKVGDAMHHGVVSVSREDHVVKCANLMKKHKIGALIVVDKTEKPIGIVTERDIVRKGLLDDLQPSQVKVDDVMESGLITVGPGEDILDAIRLMRDEDVRHLPVVHNNKVVGMVTVKDLLAIHPDLFEIWSEELVLQMNARAPLGKVYPEEKGKSKS